MQENDSMMSQIIIIKFDRYKCRYEFHTKRYMNIVVETSLLKNTCGCVCVCPHVYDGKTLFYLQINLALTKIVWLREAQVRLSCIN